MLIWCVSLMNVSGEGFTPSSTSPVPPEPSSALTGGGASCSRCSLPRLLVSWVPLRDGLLNHRQELTILKRLGNGWHLVLGKQGLDLEQELLGNRTDDKRDGSSL